MLEGIKRLGALDEDIILITDDECDFNRLPKPHETPRSLGEVFVAMMGKQKLRGIFSSSTPV